VLDAFAAARRVTSCFDEDRIPYGLGGALALGVWGAPRQTKDVDVSVFVPPGDLPRVFDSLERAGVMLDRGDAAKSALRVGLFKGRLGIIAIDVFISEHPQYDEMQRRTTAITGDAGSFNFISAEDLCIHKLIFGRSKDVTDLERLFAVKPTLDVSYIRGWLTQMVPAGDRRIGILDDLVRRFVPAT
jgi:hypothetical protein